MIVGAIRWMSPTRATARSARRFANHFTYNKGAVSKRIIIQMCACRRGGDAPPAHEVRCISYSGGRRIGAPTQVS